MNVAVQTAQPPGWTTSGLMQLGRRVQDDTKAEWRGRGTGTESDAEMQSHMVQTENYREATSQQIRTEAV